MRIGDRKNMLTVIDTYKKKEPNSCRYTNWVKVRCDCGNEKDLKASYLKNSTTKSCGCLLNDYRHSKKGEVYQDSLCWYCNSVDCSWMKGFKPVEGWEAVKGKVRTERNGYLESYLVLDCPLYKYWRGGDWKPMFFKRKPQWFGDLAIYVCPNCKNSIEKGTEICECGQKIDWRE